MPKLHCLIAFTSWGPEKYIYCNYFFPILHVISFKIELSLIYQAFFLHDQKSQDKNLNLLTSKRDFKMKKAFLITFKEISLKQRKKFILKGESLTLTSNLILWFDFWQLNCYQDQPKIALTFIGQRFWGWQRKKVPWIRPQIPSKFIYFFSKYCVSKDLAIDLKWKILLQSCCGFKVSITGRVKLINGKNTRFLIYVLLVNINRFFSEKC